MKKSILIALALILTATANIYAQDKKAVVVQEKTAERIKIQVEKLSSTLDLDETQTEKVTAIYTESEQKLDEVKERLVKLRETKVNLDSSDQEKVDAFNNAYNESMKDRATILENRKNDVASILNEDQKAKFLASETN